MIPGLVSVIIPTYDRPDYLREAVNSIFAQTYPLIEILIIDDGSSEGGAFTKSALKPYLAGDRQTPQVTYLYQKNAGLVSAVNRGLALARGGNISNVLMTTIGSYRRRLPYPSKCSKHVHRSDWLQPATITLMQRGKRLRTYPPRRCPDSSRLFNMLMGCISACAGVMVRSLVHQKVGVYRDIKAQDYEMWIRIAKEFKVETVNLPLAEYRQHPGSSIHIKDNYVKMERDILNFTREQIESTPLDELIPNLRSEPHAYALRAAIYLQKSGEYGRGILLAKAALNKARQLAPNDPLLRLWEGVLAVNADEPFPQNRDLPSPYREQAEALARFGEQHKRLSVGGVPSSSPEAVDLRREFGKFYSTLTQQTFKTAVGERGRRDS